MNWLSDIAQEDEARNERWRLAVGPPMIRAHQPLVPGPIDELAIVSWNVHVGGGDVAKLVNDLRAGTFTDGRPIRHFVLLAQETFRAGPDVPTPMPTNALGPKALLEHDSSGRRFDAETLAQDLSLFAAYVPSMRNGRDTNPETGLAEDRGNAIFSTIPIDNLTALELPMLKQRRVVLFGTASGTTTTGAAWSLELGSVHFDVTVNQWARGDQARSVVRATTGNAFVAAGDLNLGLGERKPVEILRAAFPQTQQGDDQPTRIIGPIKLRIDYQFYRLPASMRTIPYRRLDSAYNSDHFPLLGAVRFA